MPNLKNTYFALRHGESLANVAGIIVSDPETGTKKYGLSDKGKIQVEQISADTEKLNSDTIIYSSDFLRTKETATIAQTLLKTNSPVQFTPLLRERYFGRLNGSSDKNYQRVWDHDIGDPDHQKFAVESINQVVKRATQIINTIEYEQQAKSILLVSHGDLLQILQTWFEDTNPTKHRQLPHLNTAEIRRYNTIN